MQSVHWDYSNKTGKTLGILDATTNRYMDFLKTILIPSLLLLLGLALVIFGFTALMFPDRLVKANLKIVRRLNYFKRMQSYYIKNAEEGSHQSAYRRGGGAIIFMGLILVYAAVSYWLKYA